MFDLNGPRRKIRSEETWEAVRRGWEAGETAASLARRFDVGLANLWRRRASEGWERRETPDPVPEPPEGWRMYARNRMDAFHQHLAETRELAQDLARLMTGQAMDGAPLWHVGYLYRWRAEHMGPEVAARDREKSLATGHPWGDELWDADGRLRRQEWIDWRIAQLHPEEWRKWAGLPEGVAPGWP